MTTCCTFGVAKPTGVRHCSSGVEGFNVDD